MEEYPSNSRVTKRVVNTTPDAAPPAMEKKVERVTTGATTRKPKGVLRKAREAFVGDDNTSVSEYIVVDVLIPAFKRMVEDAVTQGVSRKLWGFGPQRQGSFFQGPQSWMPYNQPSTLRQPPPPSNQGLSRQVRATHKFDDIVFAARVDAEAVLNGLYNLIAEYQIASVRDFYVLMGETPDYPDERYGWTDLSGAGIRPARGGGYSIILPRPEVIN